MAAIAETKTGNSLPSRQPVILVLCCLAFGILFDRYRDPMWQLLLGASLLSLVVWLICFRIRLTRLASCSICIATVAIGGLWHHVWWNAYSSGDLAMFAEDLESPQRIRAVVQREPRWLVAPASDVFESTPNGIRTRMVLRIESLQQGSEWTRVSGSVPTFVDGQLSGFAVGDRIEATGLLSLQRQAHNPGQFDLRDFGRSERQFCSLRILHPEAITLLDRSHRWGITPAFSQMRQRLDQLIWRTLSPTNAALGSGILLGIREQLDEAEKANYLMTGTIHLLAISGLNVGILAGGILSLGALGIVSRRSALWLTIGIVTLYAGLVEFQPPVARAAVLIVVWCCSKLGGRPGFSFNTLAVAAIIVLADNPSQLFQVGAQLSFLAVATMSATHRYLYKPQRLDPLDELLQRARPIPLKFAHFTATTIGRAVAMSGLIWLLALPLVAYRFHIVAPIALLANPLLMIPITVAMLSGILFLLVGWWLPWAGVLIGAVFDGSLASIQWIVNRSAEVPGGYWWTVGPSLGFVICFCCLSLFLYAFPTTRMPARWAVSLSALAIAVGWLTPAMVELQNQKQQRYMEMIFADVGHGGCALLKLPGGNHVLFDAGSTASPGFTARTIAAMLWREQVSHLDAIIISHADLDHYNAVDRLTEFFSVGAVYSPAAMVEQTNSPAGELIARLGKRRIPVRVAAAEQSLFGQDGLELAILHPKSGAVFSNDNAGSIVCELAFAGQRILLTGDVEREGLDAILAQPVRRRLLAVAPHHGSKNSDPARFMSWCQAAHLVVCDDWKPPGEQDLSGFMLPGTQVYLTGRDGAVRLCVVASHLPPEIRTWKAQPW